LLDVHVHDDRAVCEHGLGGLLGFAPDVTRVTRGTGVH
jgi:hypothetical protein